MIKTSQKEHLDVAYMYDPDGRECGFCGNANDFADDIGFFYASIEPINTPMPNCNGIAVCKSCWSGMIGTLHDELNGVGDR